MFEEVFVALADQYPCDGWNPIRDLIQGHDDEMMRADVHLIEKIDLQTNARGSDFPQGCFESNWRLYIPKTFSMHRAVSRWGPQERARREHRPIKSSSCQHAIP